MGENQAKIKRMRDALEHREGDRVPVGEFFWTGFLKRARQRWGDDFDPYRHFDLDYVVINPNMDPRIRPFEIVEQAGEDIVVRTGFGATIRRRGDMPMPHYEAFSVSQPEAMADVELDDPADPRRFFAGGDDQINCVGDALLRDLPPWTSGSTPYVDDFAVFGSVCEPYEYLWRIIGSRKRAVLDGDPRGAVPLVRRSAGEVPAGVHGRPDRGRPGTPLRHVHLGRRGLRQWNALRRARWREVFKPHVKALIDLCHRHGLMTVYHGCGDARDIFDDMVEIGLDGYNPLEAKAHLDVVELKAKYAGRLGFVGNIDVRVLERGDPEEIRRHVRYKLQAARGGGWVCQSDHSVSSNVAPESYELAVRTLRELGNYPHHLCRLIKSFADGLYSLLGRVNYDYLVDIVSTSLEQIAGTRSVTSESPSRYERFSRFLYVDGRPDGTQNENPTTG